jgi:hypothetical protein
MFRLFFLVITVSFLSSCMSTDETYPNTLASSFTQASSPITSSPIPTLTAKPDLSSLDSETQSQIEILCQSEYFEGTQQYWKCLDKEFRTISGVSKPDLSSLDSETQSQISILCQKDYFSGTVQYRNCLKKELGRVNGLTKPDMSSVSSETQSQISILCQKDYFSGTVRYWNCLRNELTKIGVTPNEVSVETQYQAVEAQEPSTTYSSSGERILKEKPDMSGLNEIDNEIIEIKCEGFKRFGVQSYWGCLDDQIEESKKVDIAVLVKLRDDTDDETKEIILSYCDGFVRFGIESFYGCISDQLKSIGK